MFTLDTTRLIAPFGPIVGDPEVLVTGGGVQLLHGEICGTARSGTGIAVVVALSCFYAHAFTIHHNYPKS